MQTQDHIHATQEGANCPQTIDGGQVAPLAQPGSCGLWWRMSGCLPRRASALKKHPEASDHAWSSPRVRSPCAFAAGCPVHCVLDKRRGHRSSTPTDLAVFSISWPRQTYNRQTVTTSRTQKSGGTRHTSLANGRAQRSLICMQARRGQ